MDEKTFCVICEKDVEIRKISPHGNYDEQILSCDHIGRKLNLSQEERERETSVRLTYLLEVPSSKVLQE